jgi:hypothetical protein
MTETRAHTLKTNVSHQNKQAYMYVQGREVKWKRKTQEKQCTLRHLRNQLQLGRLP